MRTLGPTTIIRAIELARLIDEDMMGEKMGQKEDKRFQSIHMVCPLYPNRVNYRQLSCPNQGPNIAHNKQTRIRTRDTVIGGKSNDNPGTRSPGIVDSCFGGGSCVGGGGSAGNTSGGRGTLGCNNEIQP